VARCIKLLVLAVAFLSIQLADGVAEEELTPQLPQQNGDVAIATQPWPWLEGPRSVKVYLHYPVGKLDNINASTGLMLSLHNWGGTHARGTANPDALANRYNVVSICVDYLQSGKNWNAGGAPYDCGYLQAIDALRALYFVFQGLQDANIPFDSSRIFSAGGSGGGNVTLMVNKFAPRTFTCAIDMCGRARLIDDIAYGLPGGSKLNAGYSQDPYQRTFLSPDAQTIRFVGYPGHVRRMHELGNRCKLIVVHGTTDSYNPIDNKREMVAEMKAIGLDVEPYFLTEDILDGVAFKTTGHALGDRTQIVFKVADRYLLPESPDKILRQGKTDFELRDELVRYDTPGGQYIVSYKKGAPTVRFEAKSG
jgi:hypothetical protein